MTATVTRQFGPARKGNRRPGATVVQLADWAALKRATRWAAAYQQEQARPRAWPARTAT